MRFVFPSLLVALILVPSPAFAFPTTITMVVKEGDVVGGVGSISSGFGACDNMAVNNSGQWIVESDTNNANTDIDGVLLSGTGHGAFALYQQQGAAVTSPAGATLSSWDSIRINNLGNASFNNFLDGRAPPRTTQVSITTATWSSKRVRLPPPRDSLRTRPTSAGSKPTSTTTTTSS